MRTQVDTYTCPGHPELVLSEPGTCPICGKRLTAYILGNYNFAVFAAGMRVVDIGCGNGRQLQKLLASRCRAIGVEVSADKVRECQARGLEVIQGDAECLPFPSASFDGVICKGVIPYTLEPLAFHEIARILKPGGIVQFCYLGAGFYMLALIFGTRLMASRLYGLRTIINTWLFALTGLVLPGWLGDTIYQSRRRLKRYYAENRLTLVRDTPSKTFFGLPVFIYHVAQAAPAAESVHVVTEAAEVPREKIAVGTAA